MQEQCQTIIYLHSLMKWLYYASISFIVDAGPDITGMENSVLLNLLKVTMAKFYRNPVLRGVNPDPSICCVGDDFYLVTSSMHLYPGLPMYHSRDLIHWRCIGHCLTRPEHFFLKNNKNSPMMYAATLRYHQGIFYVICTDVHGGGNFIVFAENPAGPWSAPITVDRPMFDPSLFFDEDAKVYYTRRGEFKDKNIVQAEIDMHTGRLLTPLRSVCKGLVSDDAEGPHLFKKDGWYYLTMGEGGSRFLHMQTIARSTSPWGPFSANPANPIIDQRQAWWHPIRSLGHADFVESGDGRWWAVCLGTRHYNYDALSVIGRETFLFPVQWVDGWPIIEATHRCHLRVAVKTLSWHPWRKADRDEFEQPHLSLRWNMLAYPFTRFYSLHERPGYLRLWGTAESLGTAKQCAFVGTRMQEMAGICTTEMEFTPTKENEEAGITLYQNDQFHYDLFVALRAAQRCVVLRKTVGDLIVESKPIAVEERIVGLKIVLGPEKCLFEFLAKRSWQCAGTGLTNLLATEIASVWSGALIGLYSSGNGYACKNPADFAWFAAEFLELEL